MTVWTTGVSVWTTVVSVWTTVVAKIKIAEYYVK
jgi:hypothetical protein